MYYLIIICYYHHPVISNYTKTVHQHRHSASLCRVPLLQREELRVPLPLRKLCQLPPPTEAGGHLICSSNDQFQQMKGALSGRDSCTMWHQCYAQLKISLIQRYTSSRPWVGRWLLDILGEGAGCSLCWCCVEFQHLKFLNMVSSRLTRSQTAPYHSSTHHYQWSIS